MTSPVRPMELNITPEMIEVIAAKPVLPPLLVIGEYAHTPHIQDVMTGQYTLSSALPADHPDFRTFKGQTFALAVTDVVERQRLFDKLTSLGLVPTTLIHSRAIVSEMAEVGQGSIVLSGAVIAPNAWIGKNCWLGVGATVGANAEVSDHVRIAQGAHIGDEAKIGIGTVIGMGAVVLPQISIGADAVIAPGSVVHTHIEGTRTSALIRKSSPTRVLIYAPIVGRGGVHRLAERLTHAWAKNADPAKWAFKVLSQATDEIGEPIAWPEGWFTQLDPGPSPQHPNLFRHLTMHQGLYYGHLQRLAKEADVLWLPMPWWSMRVNVWDIDTPVITTIPDFAFDQLESRGEFADGFRMEAMMFGRHSRVICFPSDYQRKWGEAHYNFRRTRTIHYAEFLPEQFTATVDEGERVRAKHKLPKRYTLAFHCAHHKDPETILRAHSQARAKSAAVPPLVIAGIETELYIPGTVASAHYQDIQKLIRKLGYSLNHDLFILGKIDDADIGGLYAGAGCAVTASKSEGGLSGAVFEALAAGVPLVYSNLPVFTERLGNENAYGLGFPVGNMRALADAFVEAYTNPDASKQRVERGLAFIKARNWDDVAIEYLDLFGEVAR